MLDLGAAGANIYCSGGSSTNTHFIIDVVGFFITNGAAYADPWKRRKMDDLVMMLKGAIAAEGKVGLKLNVKQAEAQFRRARAVVAVSAVIRWPVTNSIRSHQCTPMSANAREAPPC